MMRQTNRSLAICASMFLIVCTGVYSLGGKEITESGSFTPRDLVSIATGSSKVSIIASQTSEISVEVSYTYSPENYQPVFSEHADRIELKEEFDGPSGLGKATWRVTVPYATSVQCSTGSGEIVIEGIRGDAKVSSGSGSVNVKECESRLTVSTGSGRIELLDIDGDLNVNTGSGKTMLEGIQGDIQFSTGSGRADLSNIMGALSFGSGSGNMVISEAIITGKSDLSAGSGDIKLTLAGSTDFDVQLRTGSGKAVLNYGGHPIKGDFVFTARENRGKIISPFRFDSETTFTQSGQTYMRKSFTRDQDSPKVIIETGTGVVELKKQ